MSHFWREHKQFIRIAAAFAATAGVSWLGLIRPAFTSASRAEADRLRGQESLEKRIADEGIPLPEDIERASADLAQMKADLQKLGQAVEVRLKAPFVVPPDEPNAKLYLQSTLIRTQQELIASASKKGVKLPKTFGFPAEIPAELAPEYLVRLGIISRVLNAALETVDPSQGQAGISEFSSVTARAEAGVSEQDRVIDPAAFLNRYLVEFHFTATSDGFVRLLHALLQEDRFLGIDQLTVSHEGSTDNKLDCTLTVAGYKVSTEAASAAKADAAQDWMQTR